MDFFVRDYIILYYIKSNLKLLLIYFLSMRECVHVFLFNFFLIFIYLTHTTLSLFIVAVGQLNL